MDAPSILYHGTAARLRPGSLIRPGRKPNFGGDSVDRNGRSVYVYATNDPDTAYWYAETLAKMVGRRFGYIYEVTPTGELLADRQEGDFKSASPLRVIGVYQRIDLGPRVRRSSIERLFGL